MSKRTQFVLLIIILLIGAILRLSNVDWDSYNHYHPDERYITWVGTSIEWPETWQSAFQPHESTFNPFYWPSGASSPGLVLEQDQPRKYAYGHLPLYLGVAATHLANGVGPAISKYLPQDWLFTRDLLNASELIEFRHIAAVGRALTALVDLATIVFVFFLGKWLFGPSPGLLAAALLALNVMHVQLAHFFTVDPFLTFFVVATVALLVSAVRPKVSPKNRAIVILLAGAGTGLAVGSKFTGMLLVLPLAVSVLIQVQWTLTRRLSVFAAAIVVAVVVFALTNPFAILDSSCTESGSVSFGPIDIPEQLSGSCYLQNVVSQGAMVRGLRDVPYVRQYDGTIPYLYFVEMQIRWGMGPMLGVVAFVGFAWTIWRAIRAAKKWWRAGRPMQSLLDSMMLGADRFPFSVGELIVLAWTLPFFLTTGALTVKFMRYLQPLTPFLMIYAAGMILSIRLQSLRRAVTFFLLLFTGLYALAFVNMYREPHPWVTASRWLFENAVPGSMILSEMWDDRLPDNVVVDGERLRRDIFELADVNWLSGTEDTDDLQKLSTNLALVSESDYLVLASNRNYGVIPRLADRYPLSSQFYDLLFEGKLGLEVAYVGTRQPNLMGLSLEADSFGWPGLEMPSAVEGFFAQSPELKMGRFDESFTVYDQPLVIIFENTGKLTVEELLEQFEQVRTDIDG